MNQRQRKIIDDLTASRERTAAAKAVIAAEQKVCIKLVVRGRTAKVDTAVLADAAGVEAVTVRQWVRRDKLAKGTNGAPDGDADTADDVEP